MEIYPIFDKILPRADREARLGQRGKVLWFTGLSGSGKSTLAVNIERHLFEKGFFAQVLDGDNIRAGLNRGLGFSEADRSENIRRIAEVARLFCQSGVVTICSFVSPTQALRDMARSIIGANDFLEIYLSAPLEVCEQRDVKGLYRKAREGALPDFTGISAPYEAPATPWREVPTQHMDIRESVDYLMASLIPQLRLTAG